MRIRLFERLRPVCPQCRHALQQDHPLEIDQVLKESDYGLIEGILHCSNPDCQLEYPVIDGIPIIVRDVRSYISNCLNHITIRRDLSGTMDSLLGDCAGAGTHFDVDRQHLSSYAWDHYADLCSDAPRPAGKAETAPTSSVLACMNAGLGLVNPLPEAPMIDLGCSVGRTTFQLAEHFGQPVIGIDMNFSMLRLAQNILRKEDSRIPVRRLGLVYDEMNPRNVFMNSHMIDFWACDAMALPFADDTFGFANALNVLDSVQSPYDLLVSIERCLKPTGTAVVACPYDWSPGATPIESWIGGHSQRSENHGAPEPFLRSLLTPDTHSHSLQNLELMAEIEGHQWEVRIHDRSRTVYSVHVVGLRKRKATS